MKPRIFIGSSSEGLDVANRIKDFFKEDYDCYLWTDNIFKNNESFLETLIKSASLFDFGFMVFSADDELIVRDKHFESARDNVLFEYGLFLGRVGLDRAFVIAQQEAKIPTDLLGITNTRYEVKSGTDGKKVATDSLEKGLAKLKKQIDESINLGHLGLLPSTVLAISYFEGFVKLAAEWLTENTPGLEIDGTQYDKGILKIVMPDSLDADIKKCVSHTYKIKNGRRISAAITYALSVLLFTEGILFCHAYMERTPYLLKIKTDRCLLTTAPGTFLLQRCAYPEDFCRILTLFLSLFLFSPLSLRLSLSIHP